MKNLRCTRLFRLFHLFVPLILAFAVLILITVPATQPALAHANLIRSSPAANATPDQPPDEIRLWFTEPLEAEYSRISLRDSEGEPVTLAPVQIPADDAHQMFVPLEPLPEGLYTITWRTVSASDGHASEGTFAFGIGVAVGSTAVEIPIREEVSPAGVVIRWLNLISLSLLAGGLGFALLIWHPTGHASGHAASSRLHRLIRAGWGAVGVCGVLVLLLQAGIASGQDLWRVPFETDLAQYITQSQYGQFWLYRMTLWLLTGAALWISRMNRRWLWAAFVLACALLMVQSLFSHAAGGTDTVAALAADGLHLLATALWIGGLLAFALVLMPVRGVRLTALEVSPLVAAFSNLMRLLVIALVITGLYATWLQVGSPDALTGTVYGRALIAKLVLFLPLLVIAAVNLFVTSHQLRQGNAIWVRTLRGLISSEIVLTAAILMAVGVMTSGAPARGVQVLREANAAAASLQPQVTPYFGMEVTDELMAHLEITPGTVGVNEFSVSLYDADGTTVEDASLIRLRFTHQRQNLGDSELRPASQGDGIYRISGANLSIPGPWRIRMTVQRPDKFDTVVDFEIEAEAAPAPAMPVIDTSIPTMERSIASLLAGAALLAVGAFYIPRSDWRRPDGRWLITAAVLAAGAVMLITGVRLAQGIGTLSDELSNNLTGELRALDAWARPAPQNSTGAVYMQIENGTGMDERLTGAAAAVAAHVELHETVITDDVGRMQAVDDVELPSGTTLAIVPFGLHMMLIDLHEDLQTGDTFPLTLEFESGRRLEVEVEVKLDAQPD